MKYNEKNKPTECIMHQSTCYKGTKEMKILGVLWHDTGCNNPNIKRYVQPDDNAPDREQLLALIGVNLNKNDWNHTTRQAGVNAFVGKLADGSISTVQTLPWNYRPWGCGKGKKGSCNDGWIQFEICEDNKKNKDYAEAVYKEACELTAYLCKLYGIDPNGTATLNGVKVPTILCHKDSANLQLGGDHLDIYDWFPTYGLDMEKARKDVAALLKEPEPTPEPSRPEDVPMRTIKKGSIGQAVKIWQVIVSATDDGLFGPATEKRTIAFQKKVFPNQPKEWDGVVGPKTWTKGLESVN